MNAKNIKTPYAFSRNPIIITDNTGADVWEYGMPGAEFEILAGSAGTAIYTGRFTPPLSVDISEIVDAYFPYLAEPEGAMSLVQVEDEQMLAEREITFNAQVGEGDVETLKLTVLPGGISTQNFTRLALTGTDVFASRFLSLNRNFLFTTRSSGETVVVRETELMPLYFLSEQPESIVIKSMTHDLSTTLNIEAPGVYVINFEEIRREFFNSSGMIVNAFQIYREGEPACRVLISRSEASKNRYLLKFRNSFGVFEMLEVTGIGTFSGKIADEDDSSYQEYLPATGIYSGRRERMAMEMAVDVESGVRSADEMRFLLDMIASDEVYLLGYSPAEVRVIPSVESLSMPVRFESPQSVKVKLMFADEESNIMPDISNASDFGHKRIFDNKFNSKFN